jgi:molybdate transport system ATP-binding protein
MMSTSIRAQLRIERPDFCLNVDLNLPDEGVSALYGHSGSGKTTCLRAMAGLERAPAGYFAIGDEVWQDESKGVFVPTYQRALGMVFQEASLFPHLSVQRNIEFGQRRSQKKRKTEKGHRLDLAEVTELLGISHLLDRSPAQLSGGERQRVAIARALLAAPKILLMDEPLAALDLKRKREILPYLERLHSELSIPIIYVSHAPDEVARLADHLVLLDQGKVVASGALQSTLARTDLPAIFSDDAGVVLVTELSGHEEDGLSRLAFPGGALLVSQRGEALGHRLRCRIHARDVSLALSRPSDSSILNLIETRVESLAPTETSGHVLVRLATVQQSGADGSVLLARVTERSARLLGLVEGMLVWAQVKAVALLD